MVKELETKGDRALSFSFHFLIHLFLPDVWVVWSLYLCHLVSNSHYSHLLFHSSLNLSLFILLKFPIILSNGLLVGCCYLFIFVGDGIGAGFEDVGCGLDDENMVFNRRDNGLLLPSPLTFFFSSTSSFLTSVTPK